MTDQVVNLNVARAVRANDNRLLSPLDCLEDAAAEIKRGDHKCESVLVITLDESEKEFNVGFYAANVNASKMIAMLECMKALVLRQMDYIK